MSNVKEEEKTVTAGARLTMINSPVNEPSGGDRSPPDSSDCALIGSKAVATGEGTRSSTHFTALVSSRLTKRVDTAFSPSKDPVDHFVTNGSAAVLPVDSNSSRAETKEPCCIPQDKVVFMAILASALQMVVAVIYFVVAFVSANDERGKEFYFVEDTGERTFREGMVYKLQHPALSPRTDDLGYIERAYHRVQDGTDDFWRDYNVYLAMMVVPAVVGVYWLVANFYLICEYRVRSCEDRAKVPLSPKKIGVHHGRRWDFPPLRRERRHRLPNLLVLVWISPP